MPANPPLDIDLDGIELGEAETRPAGAVDAPEDEQLLPASSKSPTYTKYKKSAFSALKTKLTRRTTKWKLERSGFDEHTAELIGSLKHYLRRRGLDVVNDAIQAQGRPEITQYFRMGADDLKTLAAAPARALLLAMDTQRRMTPRHSALKPNIDENGQVDLRFDGEPVTAHFYNLSRAAVRRVADAAAEPGSPKEVLNPSGGDSVFSLELLKSVICVRVAEYRKHLKHEDFRAIFTRAPMPDLAAAEPEDPANIPVPAQLI